MDRARRWVPVGVAGAAFVLYALFTPPSVYWLDSGELTAAGANLGIAHPTGFPLYLALARFASLFPLGEVAFRISLLSGVCAALAVLFVARTVLLVDRTVAGLSGAVAASGVLAVSWLFFRQATLAEVYAPTAALLCATLFLIARVGSGADARWGVTLGVVVGLGLGVHGSYRLLVFVPMAFVLIVRLRHGARWPLVVPAVTAVGFAGVHAYLPVRSAAVSAVLDWGHPETAASLLAHIRASSIFQSFEGEIFATESERWTVALGQFAQQIFDSVGPVALVLAVAGLVFLLSARRLGLWVGGVSLLWIFGDTLYSTWINPMGLADLQNGTPVVIAIAIAAGAGTIALSRLAGTLGPVVAAAVGAIAVLPAALVAFQEVPAASRGDSPSRWAEAALEQAPPGASLWVVNDSMAASLMYATTVMGARPDVAVFVRQLLPDRKRTAGIWRSAHPAVEMPATFAGMVRAAPSLWQPGGATPPPGMHLRAAAPLFQLSEGGPDMSTDDIVRAAGAIARHFDAGDGSDSVARQVQAQALNQLAVHAMAGPSASLDLADRLLAAALHANPRHARAWVNRGSVASRSGDLDAAIRMTERAAALSPNYVAARINLARYFLAVGRPKRAREHARRAALLEPGRAAAWALLAVAAHRLGDESRAAELADKARAIDPNDRDVRALLPK